MGIVTMNLRIEAGLVYLRDEDDGTWEIFHIQSLVRIRVMDADFDPQKSAYSTHEVFLEFSDQTRSPSVESINPHIFTATELKVLINTWQRFLVREHGT